MSTRVVVLFRDDHGPWTLVDERRWFRRRRVVVITGHGLTLGPWLDPHTAIRHAAQLYATEQLRRGR